MVRLKKEKTLQLLDSRYGTLVWLGECEQGFPIVTFTVDPSSIISSYKPSTPYLRKLATGLRTAHELSQEEVIEYLSQFDGVLQHYTKQELHEALSSEEEDEELACKTLSDA